MQPSSKVRENPACAIISKRHEVTRSELENAIDEAYEDLPIGDGQITLEDNAIKTREHDDQAGKLDDEARKRLHGVLLQGGCLDNTILRQNAVLAHPFWLRAPPR